MSQTRSITRRTARREGRRPGTPAPGSACPSRHRDRAADGGARCDHRNVALPHIQRALGFSGSGLEWVVTAYARRSRAAAASPAGPETCSAPQGGSSPAAAVFPRVAGRRVRHLSGVAARARAVQGAGAAIIAATALALIATTFPKARPGTGDGSVRRDERRRPAPWA